MNEQTAPAPAERSTAIRVLIANTLAFSICFACWMMNGVLVTFLVDNRIFTWDKVQVGWLIGIPVLTGSIFRLPLGVLTDKYGGRMVFSILLVLAAIPMYFMSAATSYSQFMLLSLGFGFTGASFAVGIAYTSVFFPKHQQGTALGIFGVGNAGAALTSMGAPFMLRWLTDSGANPEAWRTLPKIYAAALLVTAVLFFLFTTSKTVEHGRERSLAQRLAPLKQMRVWRFGLYYFLVFGGFVALAQWLIPYYVSAYAMPITTAGLMAAIFTLPSGLIRALGGWLSDKCGARAVMYWVLGACVVGTALLIVPRMNIESPGEGVMARASGVVTAVTTESVSVGDRTYTLKQRDPNKALSPTGTLVFPTSDFWQVPAVEVGDQVKKKELVARGVTRIHFQANVWIFTAIVFVIGIAMGIGKAAVYKHIPDYFPTDVGVVGGIVGVLGGLGGFVCPIIFGYMLSSTGLWTTSWMFLLGVSAICLVWMHLVVRRILKEKAPHALHQIEHAEA
ncbi:MAG: MFS transporter [Planctomycetota bacterium]|jgi:NNP family nitrate/nitrite transporter-like MFS transporter